MILLAQSGRDYLFFCMKVLAATVAAAGVLEALRGDGS